MHTLIEMRDGAVSTTLKAHADTDELVSERRWRAVIRPAIMLLRLIGDGTMVVHHRPGELAP